MANVVTKTCGNAACDDTSTAYTLNFVGTDARLGLGGPPRSGGDFWIWGGLCRKSYPTQNRSGGLFPPEHSPPEWGGLLGVWGGVGGDSYFLKNHLVPPRMGGTPGGFGGD